MDEAKTYRQYIEQSTFESVWGVLRVQMAIQKMSGNPILNYPEETKTLPPSNVLIVLITKINKMNQRSFYLQCISCLLSSRRLIRCKLSKSNSL